MSVTIPHYVEPGIESLLERNDTLPDTTRKKIAELIQKTLDENPAISLGENTSKQIKRVLSGVPFSPKKLHGPFRQSGQSGQGWQDGKPKTVGAFRRTTQERLAEGTTLNIDELRAYLYLHKVDLRPPNNDLKERWVRAKHPYLSRLKSQREKLMHEAPSDAFKMWLDIIEEMYNKLYKNFDLDKGEITYTGKLEKLVQAFQEGLVVRPVVVAYPNTTKRANQKDFGARYLESFTDHYVGTPYLKTSMHLEDEKILPLCNEYFFSMEVPDYYYKITPQILLSWLTYKNHPIDEYDEDNLNRLRALWLPSLENLQGTAKLQFLCRRPPLQTGRNALETVAEKGMDFISYDQAIILGQEGKNQDKGIADINPNGEYIGLYGGASDKDKHTLMVGRLLASKKMGIFGVQNFYIYPTSFDPSLPEGEHFVI